MNSVFKSILGILKTVKKDLIYGLIILLLIGSLSISINNCSNNRREYENNIIALNDTIHYYQGKNGNLVATIRGFETDIKTLKLLNEDLYEQIKNLKAKGDITNGTSFNGVIENPKQDTAWVVLHDTIYKGFYKEFDFNDEFRILEGNVSYKNDTVGIAIEKDQVMFDYLVAMDDKNNIMITSNNPYVKYNKITGFQLPSNRTLPWTLDIYGDFNWAPVNHDRFYDVGLLLGYKFKRFTLGPKIFYNHNLLTKEKGVYIGGNIKINILNW